MTVVKRVSCLLRIIHNLTEISTDWLWIVRTASSSSNISSPPSSSSSSSSSSPTASFSVFKSSWQITETRTVTCKAGARNATSVDSLPLKIRSHLSLMSQEQLLTHFFCNTFSNFQSIFQKDITSIVWYTIMLVHIYSLVKCSFEKSITVNVGSLCSKSQRPRQSALMSFVVVCLIHYC